jgi:hypothetical protein
MRGLGRIFDISQAINVVDLAGGATTGARVHLRNYRSVAIVVFKEAGADAEPVTFTVQEHTASTAGTSADLAVITEYYHKTEATLDGDETWTKVTQTAAATFAQASGDSDMQAIIVVEIEAASLSAGYEWISVNGADVTTAGQFGGVLYLLHGLAIQREPTLLASPLT